MSQLNPPHSLNQRLLQVAKEYRQQGYSVTLHPSSAELPPALSACAVDLVAERENHRVIVKVETRETLKCAGANDLRYLTSIVQTMPGWEVELVVTNPRHTEA